MKNNQSVASYYKTELVELIHFIRTPLSSIKIGSDILKDFLPILIETYKTSNQSNSIDLNVEKLNKLALIFEGLIVEASRISEHLQKIEVKIQESCNDRRL